MRASTGTWRWKVSSTRGPSVYSWAERLPEGWIGVPTYHPGYRLHPAMEAALARSCRRLRFLPDELAQGLTEPLLLAADGMITVSSTTAMTGLLRQKRVIVTGTSPYRGWCCARPEDLENAVPLTPDEATSTLAFLCNRYVHDHGELTRNPALLAELLGAVVRQPDPAAWFMDMSAWSIRNVRSLFQLTVP